MAARLKPDDKDDRPWYLLAVHRAEQLEAAMRDRRQFVETQLRLADEAMRAGRPNQAVAIKSQLVDQYKGYSDLADLFPDAPPAQPAADPAPGGPAPAVPGQGGAAPASTSPATTPDAPVEPKPAGEAAPETKPGEPGSADAPAPEPLQ